MLKRILERRLLSQKLRLVFSEYKGKIYVDSRAGMISINPTLIRSQSSNNVAYTVTNNYKDSSGKTKTEQSQLKNGKHMLILIRAQIIIRYR